MINQSYINYLLIVFLILISPISSSILSDPTSCSSNIIKYSDHEKAQIPLSFDARLKWPSCISGVRNQGICSSCWAMTASSVLSDTMCIASNKTVKKLLSPQYMVDCSHNCKPGNIYCNLGCKLGYLDLAIEYTISNGLVSDQCYPYKESESTTCPTKCNNQDNLSFYYGKSCKKFTTIEDAQLEIMNHGSIIATLDIHSDLYTYKSGLYAATGEYKEGHAARVVGWGTLDTKPFWLLANSWGTDWGMNGYFLIERGQNIAMVETNLLGIEPDTSRIPESNVNDNSVSFRDAPVEPHINAGTFLSPTTFIPLTILLSIVYYIL
ncbi:hypothetical protein SAMD00019534_059660, partial [Acytostelium subglobosum LB1]|uniref:hypothetical protein n=1 Tax=Acytostelium subglobosum LB1 TaxID=1410327 RepID=UPI0006449756